MSDNENQDEAVELPSVITLSKFSAARSREIRMMKKALATSSGAKLAFQRLPKHMRRRTMSHNVKRLPRRLREIHINQMKKSGLPPKQKRPSRKYRRRPYNLVSEYIKRQRRCYWLNTHIWHAKRFHMVEKWGYKLPRAPCDKSFRACYRATVNHCLLQDISYYSCIEIIGDYNNIIKQFRNITTSSNGLTIEARAFVTGLRGGSVTLLRYDNKRAIGIVEFLWRPVQENGRRMLWLWLHPAFSNEVLDTLMQCFDFLPNGDSFVNKDNVQLNTITNEINRFRLTGKLSTSTIHNTFKLSQKCGAEWIENYRDSLDPKLLDSYRDHWEYFKYMSSPSVFSPYVALPFIIFDPRFNLPKKRTKNIPLESPQSGIPLVNKPIDSPIWRYDVRKSVTKSIISNSEISEMRQTLLVPGSVLECAAAAIPIILLQRPGLRGAENNGYGSGWDIIFPSKWAQPFWISLIMWGARAGGLRETNSIAFESSQQSFLYPDTAAGVQEEQLLTKHCKDTYFRLPPNKRTNFTRFKISSPFEMNWSMLIKEWKNEDDRSDFSVLRNKNELKMLQEKINSKSPCSSNIGGNYLIPVEISLTKKGSCKPFAIICLPDDSDYNKEPVETHCLDPNWKLRKQMRGQHKMLLKRLRRKRVRSKCRNMKLQIDQELLRQYTTKMRQLWLPQPRTIRKSCSREIIGFIKQGDFSFTLGKTKGIGYIVSGALENLLSKKNKNKILIRNTDSKQYRLASLNIICE